MQSQLRVRLPFRLAVPTGREVISYYDGDLYKVGFSHPPLSITGRNWREPLPATVALVTLDTKRYGELPYPLPKEILVGFFQASFDYLNHFIDVYRTVEGDYAVRNITLLDFPAHTTLTVDGVDYGYVINDPHWVARGEDDVAAQQERLGRIIGAMDLRDRWPGLQNTKRFYASARLYLEQGNHFNAVIDLETAFELQVQVTLSMILTHRGIPEARRTALLKTPLKNVIEHHFATYLGGDFSYTAPGPINDWHAKLYSLRNQCVHEGYFFVSGTEVAAAFDAYHAVQDYIRQKLVDNGLLDAAGMLNLDEHAPRRRVELNHEALRERLAEAGYVERDGTFTRDEPLPTQPDTGARRAGGAAGAAGRRNRRGGGRRRGGRR